MSAFGGKADIARDLLRFTHFIISSTDGQDADSGAEQGRSDGYEFESHSRKRNQTAGAVSVELLAVDQTNLRYPQIYPRNTSEHRMGKLADILSANGVLKVRQFFHTLPEVDLREPTQFSAQPRRIGRDMAHIAQPIAPGDLRPRPFQRVGEG